MNWWLAGPKLVSYMAPPLFLALGVTVGGGLLGAFGHWIAGNPHEANASAIAFRIRIWAVAVALGGTISALEHFEQSLTSRAVSDLLRGSIALIAAYGGAELGYWLLRAWMLP